MKMDQKLLSNEKHEKAYVKKIAKNILANTDDFKLSNNALVRVSSLRRLAKYVLKN